MISQVTTTLISALPYYTEWSEEKTDFFKSIKYKKCHQRENWQLLSHFFSPAIFLSVPSNYNIKPLTMKPYGPSENNSLVAPDTIISTKC